MYKNCLIKLLFGAWNPISKPLQSHIPKIVPTYFHAKCNLIPEK